MGNNYRFIPEDLIIYYDKVLQNFIHNFNIQSINKAVMIEYLVKDEDTPENICIRLYNDSSLSWLLLYINNKIDPFFDWPLNTEELNAYIDNKYASRDDVHHWVKGNYIVNETTAGASSISNYQYELMENDKKRLIRIPSVELVSQILEAFGNSNG